MPKGVYLHLASLTGCIQLNIHIHHLSSMSEHNAGTGTRIASIMGGKKVLMMANHGVLIATETIAEAFDFMYYVERAAEVTVKALSSGRPLKPIRDEVCKMTHDKFVVSGVAKVRVFQAKHTVHCVCFKICPGTNPFMCLSMHC